MINLKDQWNLLQVEDKVYISKTAVVGKSVVFKGSAIVGPETKIINNAIIGDKVIVGNNCLLENYCKISKLSYIGDNSVIGHCAEISGILEADNIVMHHCYYRGVMGRGVNLGAGSCTGTDRFDHSFTKHYIDGKQIPVSIGANEVYMGEHSRTGVNSVMLAGNIIGKNSIIGPGTISSGVIPDCSLVYSKQNIQVRNRKLFRK